MQDTSGNALKGRFWQSTPLKERPNVNFNEIPVFAYQFANFKNHTVKSASS